MVKSLHSKLSAILEMDYFVLCINLLKRWAAQSSNLEIVFRFFLGFTLLLLAINVTDSSTFAYTTTSYAFSEASAKP